MSLFQVLARWRKSFFSFQNRQHPVQPQRSVQQHLCGERGASLSLDVACRRVRRIPWSLPRLFLHVLVGLCSCFAEDTAKISRSSYCGIFQSDQNSALTEYCNIFRFLTSPCHRRDISPFPNIRCHRMSKKTQHQNCNSVFIDIIINQT